MKNQWIPDRQPPGAMGTRPQQRPKPVKPGVTRPVNPQKPKPGSPMASFAGLPLPAGHPRPATVKPKPGPQVPSWASALGSGFAEYWNASPWAQKVWNNSQNKNAILSGYDKWSWQKKNPGFNTWLQSNPMMLLKPWAQQRAAYEAANKTEAVNNQYLGPWIQGYNAQGSPWQQMVGGGWINTQNGAVWNEPTQQQQPAQQGFEAQLYQQLLQSIMGL